MRQAIIVLSFAASLSACQNLETTVSREASPDRTVASTNGTSPGSVQNYTDSSGTSSSSSSSSSSLSSRSSSSSSVSSSSSSSASSQTSSFQNVVVKPEALKCEASQSTISARGTARFQRSTRDLSRAHCSDRAYLEQILKEEMAKTTNQVEFCGEGALFEMVATACSQTVYDPEKTVMIEVSYQCYQCAEEKDPELPKQDPVDPVRGEHQESTKTKCYSHDGSGTSTGLLEAPLSTAQVKFSKVGEVTPRDNSYPWNQSPSLPQGEYFKGTTIRSLSIAMSYDESKKSVAFDLDQIRSNFKAGDILSSVVCRDCSNLNEFRISDPSTSSGYRYRLLDIGINQTLQSMKSNQLLSTAVYYQVQADGSLRQVALAWNSTSGLTPGVTGSSVWVNENMTVSNIPNAVAVLDYNQYQRQIFGMDVPESEKQNRDHLNRCGAIDSPLMIDLDRNGIQLGSQDQGALFDLEGQGEKVQISSTQGKDAYLALDLNGNGRIDSIHELFGNNTLGADQRLASNGFEALAKHDLNSDGILDSKDAIFPRLKLWLDSNGNGISEDSELASLEASGIESISLRYTSIDLTDAHGNRLLQKATLRMKDGSTRDLYDVWFSYSTLGAASKTASEEWALALFTLGALSSITLGLWMSLRPGQAKALIS